MKYLNFIKKFKDYPVITYQNIRNVFEKVNHTQLINWQKRGLLLKLKRGIFALPDKTIDPHIIAGKLNYSYISLEYALSYCQIIPDIARVITSVSKNRNEKINNGFGDFHYRKISGQLFTGFTLIKTKNGAFRIATVEKALFDLVYFRSDLKNKNDLEAMRLNIGEKFDIEIIKKFTKLVKASRIKNRLENLIAYLYDVI